MKQAPFSQQAIQKKKRLKAATKDAEEKKRHT